MTANVALCELKAYIYCMLQLLVYHLQLYNVTLCYMLHFKHVALPQSGKKRCMPTSSTIHLTCSADENICQIIPVFGRVYDT